MSSELQELRETLLHLLQDLVARDKEAREKYQVGEKFKFIQTQLQHALTEVEENLQTLKAELAQSEVRVLEDETLVYVYLFNAQGLLFKTWQKMLSPAVFYEYSVNRPIYMDKAHVESFIRSKPIAAQHAYLVVAVKKKEILPAKEEVELKDPIGNPLVKIAEGSLRIEKLCFFIHAEHEYTIGSNGELVRKL